MIEDDKCFDYNIQDIDIPRIIPINYMICDGCKIKGECSHSKIHEETTMCSDVCRRVVADIADSVCRHGTIPEIVMARLVGDI